MPNGTVANSCKLTVSCLQLWLFRPIGAHQSHSAVHSRIYMQSYIRMDVQTLSACIHTEHTQKPAPYYCLYYGIIAVVKRVCPYKPIHAKCHPCSDSCSKWYSENCRQPMLQLATGAYSTSGCGNSSDDSLSQ